MDTAEEQPPRPYDVVIIGAGLSGINAAYRLQSEIPTLNYIILESRPTIGGTWELFRYPGIRSDSSLWTFGFPWHPWAKEKGIADGAEILEYIGSSAHVTGIDQKIRFNHKLLGADWSSDTRLWNLQIENKNQPICSRFLMFCTGYYDHDQPLSTLIPGISDFEGRVIHPQFWPESTKADFNGKKIVVIGSGATAVSLIPALAETAANVTMLQRSPSYIATSGGTEPLRQNLQKYFPLWLVYRIMRVRSIVIGTLFAKYCAYFPLRAREILRKATTKHLPEHIPHDPHFEPKYNPWEQRLCLDLNGAFYSALRERRADVVTDTITNVTKSHIELASGQRLKPDIIVTATGLKLQFGGATRISVDGQPIELGQKLYWKNTMIQDIPNAAFTIGYPDASWTLGADVNAWLVCRLLKHMRRSGLTSATARRDNIEGLALKSSIALSSTYVAKGSQSLPKVVDKAPWYPRSTYIWDLWDAKYGSISKCMEYK